MAFLVAPQMRRPLNSRHKTERVSMQIPLEWVKVLRRIAAQTQRPLTWIVLGLIKKEATSLGLDELPLLPWEKLADETGEPEK